MFRLTVTLSTVAAVLATTAAAAPSPTALVLRAGDFPRGTNTTVDIVPAAALAPFGRGIRGALWTASIPAGSVRTSYGSQPKTWSVTGDIVVAPDRASAQRLFQRGKSTRAGFGSHATGPITSNLPRFGDEQLAFWMERTPNNGPEAGVFVRRGSVLWQVAVTGVPREWSTTRAQVVAQLERYARMQQRRVGAG
jgi:hypothetical protein